MITWKKRLLPATSITQIEEDCNIYVAIDCVVENRYSLVQGQMELPLP